MQLNLAIYTPSNYILASKIDKYIDIAEKKGKNLTQAGREQGGPGIKRLYGDYVISLEKNDMGR